MLRRGLLLLVSVLALLPQRGTANSYAVGSLDQTPSADEVFAFASRPPVPTPHQEPPLPSAKQLIRDDLLVFLREGIRRGPDFSPKRDPEDVWCTGVFFTRDGTAYHWTLWNRRTLSLITTDYRHAYLTLNASSVQPKAVPRGTDEFRPLQPPAAGDVLHFANADRPGTGFQIPRTEADIVRFLQLGKVVPYATFSQQLGLRDSARLTLPAKLAERLRSFGQPLARDQIDPREVDVHVGGSFATKDARVFFWEQWGDDVIHLSDSAGAECVLKIP